MNAPLLLVLTLCLVGQLSPGPDMLLLVRHCARGPLRHALACSLGVTLGLAVHLAMAVLGLAWILTTEPRVLLAIQYLGAGYLIWLGCKTWQRRATEHLPASRGTGQRHLARSFAEGLFCNLLNPKVTLFMLSLFTQVITPDTRFPDKLVIAAAILLEAALVWVLFVLGLNLPRLQRLFKRYLPQLNQLAALLFIGLGVGLLWMP